MSDKLQRLHTDISESLNEIAALFDREHTPMITLIVRTPWLDDGDVLMGNDDYDKAITAINRLRSREPVRAALNPTPATLETDPQKSAEAVKKMQAFYENRFDKKQPEPQPTELRERYRKYRDERCPHVISVSRWGCDTCTILFVQQEIARAQQAQPKVKEA